MKGIYKLITALSATAVLSLYPVLASSDSDSVYKKIQEPVQKGEAEKIPLSKLEKDLREIGISKEKYESLSPFNQAIVNLSWMFYIGEEMANQRELKKAKASLDSVRYGSVRDSLYEEMGDLKKRLKACIEKLTNEPVFSDSIIYKEEIKNQK